MSLQRTKPDSKSGIKRATLEVFENWCVCSTLNVAFNNYHIDILWHANNKGQDQTTHSRSMVSGFVVLCAESITAILISRLYLVSVAELAGLSLILSQISKTFFLCLVTVSHETRPEVIKL